MAAPARKRAKQHKLTPKQQRFVAEYLKTSNATQAAINAGFSPNFAGQYGSKLLNHPNIAAKIASRVESTLSASDVNPRRVIEELARLALGDSTAVLDENGNIRPVNELSEDVRRSISSIEVSDSPIGGRKTKVRTWDKVRALEILAKHLGLLVERVEISVSDDLSARLSAGRTRLRELPGPVVDAVAVQGAETADLEPVGAETPILCEIGAKENE